MSELNFVPEEGVAGKFISCIRDENGIMKDIQFQNTENFNFAFDVVDALGKKCPGKTAMLHISKEGRERNITFKDMMEYSSRTANYLQFLGIKKGDRVLVVLKRHYQFWFTVIALHKIGAVAIPASYLLVKKDFEYRFRAARIDGVISTSDGDVSKEIDKALKSYEGIKTKVLVGGVKAGWNSYNREIKYFSREFPRPANAACGEDPSIMFFTSGTTSYPKIAAHSFTYPLGHYITAKEWHQVDPDGMHFAISDTGWAKAMWGKLYGQWLCEAPIFTYDYDEFFAKEILAMLEKYKITSFCAPPTVYRVLVHTDLANYNLSSLKNVTTAGEALNPEIYNKFYNATGLKIMEGFGQTESTLIAGTLKGMEPRPGSMGKPNPLYDISIMKPDGTNCIAGEVGEICIKTSEAIPKGLFLGYFFDEERTSQVWHDGFYHTGDTAYMDKDGYLWYVGRVDDLIKSAGFRVGPFEIENEIMKLPYVLECAVTSIPDKIRGQAIKASIVLTDGIEATDILRKEIMKFLRGNMASYKRPKVVEFVKSLPKTSSGKVRRAEIKENDWNKDESKNGKN
ncbi:transcriptional regulator, XRE family with cupin sensor [Eubacterium ruminantium]|nr:transcriptional regulator, XRE family with cupin sensor [Eubacterium ruminantium]